MSNKTKPKKVLNIKEIKMVPAAIQEQCLQTSIYELGKTHKFLGSVLQCMNITFSYQLPTAGVYFDVDGKKWQMDINPIFYCECLTSEHRVAVLLHEMSHITNKHPIRVPFLKIAPEKRQWMNIAADMAINQYIKNLPNGCKQCPSKDQLVVGVECPNEKCPGNCIDVKDYYDIDDNGKKTPWPANQTMEHYYELLLRRAEDMNYSGGKCSNCGTEMQDGEGEGNDGEGEGNGVCPKCGKKHGTGKPKEFDKHNWGEGGEENDMLDATEELVKRAMIKSSIEYDELPGNIKELLVDIEARRTELNYKALILQAIKRSATGHERKHSWTRKSKRFGNYAPGTKPGDLPKLDMFIDSSGSISVHEGNEFLDIVDNFLQAGCRKCNLNIFHTENYYRKPYKLGQRLDKRDWQSGGTCLEQSLRIIAETRPDLTIILTDGYYSNVEVEKWLPNGVKFPHCLFIISRDGTEDHPLKRLGYTIKIPKTTLLADDKKLEEK